MALSRDIDLGFPPLGVGTSDDLVNQLIEAPEDGDEFDIWNDQTFGGMEDGDWEDEHNRMAVELEGSSFFDSGPNYTSGLGDSGFITMDKGHISTISQEDEMEQSVRRLVVEDTETSKGFTPNGQPIPGLKRQAHLEKLFGPNSPPGYMDLETLGNQRNIWGSPSLDSNGQKGMNNTLQALFASAKQAAIRDFPGVFGPDASGGHMQGPALPAEAPTLAEIEHNMMAREQQKPKVLTAEELERQLRGDPPLPTSPNNKPPYSSGPSSIPPMGTAVAFRKQQPIPGQGPPLGMAPMGPGESSPINISRPPTHRMPPYPANRMFGSPMVRPSPPPTHVPPPPIVSPYGSPSTQGMPNRGLVMEHQQSPPNRPRMIYPSGKMYTGHHMPPPQQPPPPVRHSNYYGHGHQYFDRRDHHYHQRGNAGHYGNHQHRYEMNTNDFPDREAEDEYAGLMTKKEKDWIIKIQLFQLQTDNPYLDDYYYTYYTMKKKAMERDKQTGRDGSAREPELLIPSMIKIEPRVYTPAQFEGSLGRLTAASVHNPRQIIDVCRNVSPTNEESGKKSVSRELRRYRQLLMDIEKGFNMILDVDDIEKKVLALPDENRMPLFEERVEKIQCVYDYFMQDESLKNFLPAMGVRKGRKLLARLMPLLDKIQQLSIVTVLLSHLRELIKKDAEDEGLQVLSPALSRYFGQCDLEFLVHFAAILQKHPQQNEEGISLLLKHKFGVTLLCNLIKTGEHYFSNTSPVDIDNQLKTQWIQFIEEFVESLASTSPEEIAWPTTHQPTVGCHLDRFVNNKLIGSLEDKLARLTKSNAAISVS